MKHVFLSPHCARRLLRRRGVVTLELLLWLPILVIFVLAIVEFALIMQFNKQIAYASRFGAKLASEITRDQTAATNLSNFNQSGTPNNLKDQIDAYLANHGITASCEVQLQHNACVGGTSQTDTDDPCNCGPSPTALPGGEPPAGEAHVKVTVCVKLTGNVPNCLSTFGFDLNGPDGSAGTADDCTVEHSTVFRIETNNAPPDAVITTTASTGGVPTPALPADTPPNPVIQLNFANADPTTSVNVVFTALNSSDDATAAASLTFNWATTGTAVGPTNLVGFTSQFNVPGTPGVSAGAVDETVTLSVSDTCAQAGVQAVTIRLVRAGP